MASLSDTLRAYCAEVMAATERANKARVEALVEACVAAMRKAIEAGGGKAERVHVYVTKYSPAVQQAASQRLVAEGFRNVKLEDVGDGRLVDETVLSFEL